MSAEWKQSYDLPPDIQLTVPTSQVQREDPSNTNKASVDGTSVHLQRARYAGGTSEKHVRIPEPSPRRRSSGSIRYLGSYRQSPHRSRVSLDRSTGAKTPVNSVPPSPRASISQGLLEHLLQDADIDLNSYGLEELRDGFFDASFDRSLDPNHAELIDAASTTLPRALWVDRPKSLGQSVFKHGQETIVSLRLILTTESGIKCAKSFLGFFIAYIICLIPRANDWLGNYSYILTLSAILNHAGRSVGSQIDGLILTILGTAAGLGWGSLALFVSTSTGPARSGYGGALATFLVLLTASLAWLRCIFTRFYQAVICAGIALCYTCLADTSEVVGWEKIFDYGIPWILGQAISLGVCLLLFPDTGSWSLAVALHNSLNATLQSLEFPQPDNASIRRTLAWNFVNLSQAVRDFTLELTLSRFQPEDVRTLRNLIQGMLRGSLALRPYTTLFEGYQKQASQELAESIVKIGNVAHDNFEVKRIPSSTQAMQLVTAVLARPTAALLESIRESVSGGDAILMDISGYRSKLSSDNKYLSALTGLLRHLRTRMTEFDDADLSLIDHPSLPPTYSDHPEVVDLFLFVHPVRQVADKVEAFLEKVVEIQGKKRGLKILPPSYPMRKSLFRANCQVRHDRGGLTAGSYFRTKRELEKTMRKLQSTAYIPLPRHYSTANPHLCAATDIRTRSFDGYIQQDITKARRTVSETRTIRYRIWQLLHRLQGFEARFALKVTIVTTLLSIPAWLPQSNRWWNSSESWWAVVVVWLNMHPRVGGNLQDLTSRTLCVVIGSVWGGLAYGAGNGSPFVMAVFAAIFMIPMMYRYTQSSHPRSGLIGCISFTIISLTIYKHGGSPTAIYMAWTRGLAFLVGVVAAVVVNCILWPFIARHELRKSLAMMMLYAAVLYRGVVAKYVYSADGEEPSSHDLERSEMLEGRLREGFVRIRQLMELTRHEIVGHFHARRYEMLTALQRLRAPFDVLPYSALTDACERFFDHLVEIRQSSVYFQPYMLAGTASAKEMLISVRRDAVAAILMNLYILAGALRAGRPVPRYLPSAAAARKRLLNRMEQVEREQIAVPKRPKPGKSRRWADVYQYAYSSALTDIVEELQQLQVYTKAITGEVGFDIKEQKVR